jgi:integrase/recombinase XerD
MIAKTFYKWLEGDSEIYPKKVRWIKPNASLKNLKTVQSEDLLTEEDVKRMISKAKTMRDKAILSVLFESGFRASEFLSMKVKHVKFGEPAYLSFDEGKTGARTVPVLNCVPYLAHYLNSHPHKDNRESFLWVLNGADKPLEYGTLRKIIKVAGNRAGLNRRLYPHLFRHSQSTLMANRMTEQQLKMYFGWAGDSKMASVYVHLSGKDLTNAVLEANGKKPREIQDSKLKPKTCQRCRLDNEPSALYCTRCGYVLDCETVIEYEKRREKIVSWMEKYPDLLRMIEEIVRKEGL